MSVDLMRVAIQKVYPGEKWKHKVLQMKDGQVIAIYRRLLDGGKL